MGGDLASSRKDAHSARRAGKVGHRKSRNGCTVCKGRRVKCDESRPICGNCLRLELDCAWPRTGSVDVGSATAASNASGSTPASFHHAQSSGASTMALGMSTGTYQDQDYPQQQDANEHHRHQRRQHAPQSPGTTFPPSDDLSEFLDRMSARFDQAGPPIFPPGDDPRLDDVTIPESRQRRLLEHRLMQNQIFNIAMPFPVAPADDWRSVWSRHIPAMALEHENVMFAILAMSATHLLRSEPGNAELFSARQVYVIAAMREQRRVLETGLTSATADPVCLAALLILITTFAMLHERSLPEEIPDGTQGTDGPEVTEDGPYEPPIDWIRLGKGSGVIMWLSFQVILKGGGSTAANGDDRKPGSNPSTNPTRSHIITIINSHPRLMQDESYFDASLRRDFEAVLNQSLPNSGDDWSDEATREAYEKALSYVGSMQTAIDSGEPLYSIGRRLHAFTLLLTQPFVDFLAQKRPRALVVLAYFFATVAQLKGVWWLGGQEGITAKSPPSSEDERGPSWPGDTSQPTAKREIRAIARSLPSEWMGLMIWPMDKAGLMGYWRDSRPAGVKPDSGDGVTW